jgi:hypothetical protein
MGMSTGLGAYRLLRWLDACEITLCSCFPRALCASVVNALAVSRTRS